MHQCSKACCACCAGNDDAMDDDQDDLMMSWFRLVKQRYELIRDESELIYRRRQQELEDVHGDVEYQLRRLLQKPELLRTPEDKELEEELLGLLLKTVTDRNSIVDSMEVDRIRYIEEDKNIDEMLKTAGLTSPVSRSGSKSLKDKRAKKKKTQSLKETDSSKPKKSLLRLLSSKKKADAERNEATSVWL